MIRFRFRVCLFRYTGMCFVKLVGRTGKNVIENRLNKKNTGSNNNQQSIVSCHFCDFFFIIFTELCVCDIVIFFVLKLH